MSEFTSLEVTWGPATRVTLNRPAQLNAINADMADELYTVLQQIAIGAHDTRALLITGAGRGFCSGADLAAGDATRETGKTLMRYYNPIMLELVNLPVPIVTAINGVAAGAGMSLALAGDFVLAAQSASFLQAFVNIGLVPDAGSSYWLPRLVGPQRARQLMMLGEKLPAETAADWGLIMETHSDEALPDAANALLERLAAGPTRAYAGIRRLMQNSMSSSYEGQMQLEANIQREMLTTSDSREGVTAFLEKRPARFTGT